MKKLALLATITLMGVSATCFSQVATVNLNNFDSNNAIMYMATPNSPAVAAPLNLNINVELLGGPSATQLQPVTPSGGGSAVIPLSAVAGFFDGGVGVVPGVTAGATATFQLLAFVGTNPSAASGGGVSATWTEATGTWNNAAVPPAPATGPVLNVPTGITVGAAGIPEPSTIALGLLGLGALLIRRK